MSAGGRSSKSRGHSALLRSASWLGSEVQGTRAEFADRIYQWRKSPAALDSAIAAYERAVAAAPVGSDEYTRCLGNLAICFSQRFSAAGDPADLDEAIARGRQAYNSTPLLNSDRARIMTNLAIHLNRRYHRSRELADLEACVFFAGAGARETSPWKRKDAAWRWARFGQFTFEKYRDTGSQADLHAAIDASRKAVAATRSGDSERAARLATLSASLLMRYWLTRSQADLDEAAATAAAAVARLPADPGERAGCLSALAQVQLAQFERAGQLRDLERAVETERRAVACWPAGDQGRAGSAAELAMALASLSCPPARLPPEATSTRTRLSTWLRRCSSSATATSSPPCGPSRTLRPRSPPKRSTARSARRATTPPGRCERRSWGSGRKRTPQIPSSGRHTLTTGTEPGYPDGDPPPRTARRPKRASSRVWASASPGTGGRAAIAPELR